LLNSYLKQQSVQTPLVIIILILDVTTFQTIGINGAVYPFSYPDQTYSFPLPVQMNFDPTYLRNKVVLLLSDYTINTIFNFAQQSGNLWTTINNDTTSFPMTVDTKGLGLIVPELSEYFGSENFNCTLKVGIQGIHKQPVIFTQDDGADIKLNFGIFIDVHNESSIFDDPFNAVNLNLDFNIKVNIVVVKDMLSVQFGNIRANSVVADSHIGPIDTDKSKKTLESIVKVAITQFSGSMRNIDLVKILNDYLGLTFYNIVVDPNPGHHGITLNYKN